MKLRKFIALPLAIILTLLFSTSAFAATSTITVEDNKGDIASLAGTGKYANGTTAVIKAIPKDGTTWSWYEKTTTGTKVTYTYVSNNMAGLTTAVDGNKVYAAGMPWIDGERTSDTAVKYAVQLWGIMADKDSSGNDLGLTFGPALGDNYMSKKVSHTPTGVTNSEKFGSHPKRCIHEDSWAEIVYWSKTDPYVYSDCIEKDSSHPGCTKAVPLTPDGTIIKNGSGSEGATKSTDGDGSGILYSQTINDAYRKWNDTDTNEGGWKKSKMRNTLNGSTDATGSFTESNCLLSCFPTVLKEAIKPKKIDGDYSKKEKDGSGTDPDSVATTYDKLWLFSTKEMGFGSYQYSQGKGSNYTHAVSQIGNTDGNAIRKGYQAAGSASFFWLRSPITYNTAYVCSVSSVGGGYSASGTYGVAPGFCLE